MPYITFVWHPSADDWRVGPIMDDLRAIATVNNVSFCVNAQDDDDTALVVVRKGTAISPPTLERLHDLATKAGVTIYVDPALDAPL